MRCLFTMFAEDVGILRGRSFTDVLLRYQDRPPVLRQMLTALWRDMNHGTAFSTVIILLNAVAGRKRGGRSKKDGHPVGDGSGTAALAVAQTSTTPTATAASKAKSGR